VKWRVRDPLEVLMGGLSEVETGGLFGMLDMDYRCDGTAALR